VRLPVISINNITRSFGKFVAVDSLNLCVQKNEIFGLLGPNGAGKTTTIKMLTTLLPPSSGSATVGGLDVVSQSSEVRSIIGYVPQLLSADASLTGFENLLIFGKLYDVPKGELVPRIRQAIEMMGLTDFGDKLVRTYSGGMIRRLEIAQSTLHRPRVLFLDEPTVGLDPLARHAVWDMITQLREDFGTTVFLTTHLMDEAEVLCDRIGIMHRSKLVALGSPKELKDQVGADSLDQVFIHFTGDSIQTGGNYRDIQRERQTARRLG
jgi:ABC-2 type transport system ATP-binding protein